MNKKIIISLSIIGVVAAAVVGFTIAYFNDTETSIGNTFSAGEIDLKIDMHCDYRVGCGFPLKDLNYDPLFYDCDIKPGDSHESTISLHVYNNNAWGRITLPHVYNFEYGCTQPEEDVDSTCGSPGDGEGEMDENLFFTIWIDDGQTLGWQCSELLPPNNVAGCPADPKEGDNKLLEGVETILVNNVPVSQFPSEIILPWEIIASYTYYVGVRWTIPGDVGNIIQTDSLNGVIIIDVVQSKNNPWPPTF